MFYKIYKLDLKKSNIIKEGCMEFEEEDRAISFCHEMNSVADIDLYEKVWFHFYIKLENCFYEHIKKEELIEEAKKQISIRLKSLTMKKVS